MIHSLLFWKKKCRLHTATRAHKNRWFLQVETLSTPPPKKRFHFRPTTMRYKHGLCELNANIFFSPSCPPNYISLLHAPQIQSGLSDPSNVNIEWNFLIPFTYDEDLKGPIEKKFYWNGSQIVKTLGLIIVILHSL